jgi:tetratricopeptide (TPR) repeat protein
MAKEKIKKCSKMRSTKIDIEKLEKVIDPLYPVDKEENMRQQKYLLLVYRALQKRKMIRRTIWSVSSAAAILIGAWLLIGPKNTSPNYLKIYQEFYKPTVFQTQYRGEKPEQSLFTQILTTYSEQNFQSALVLADALEMQNSPNPDYILLLASVYQANGLYDKAIRQFELLLPTGGSYEMEANWYLALLSLKQGNLKVCKTYLRRIIQSKDITHMDEARSLLSKIR